MLEKGGITLDETAQKFSVNFAKFENITTELVREICVLQATGDYDGTKALFEKYAVVSKSMQVGLDKLKEIRSTIPAITHVDYSARIQSVDEKVNPRYYAMIKAFQEKTGCPVIINTSFNVRGEPIVCTPEDAWICFMRTNMDYLIMGNYLLEKTEQKALEHDIDWQKEYELD